MSNLKLFNDAIRNNNTQQYLADVLGEKKQQFVNNMVALVANNAKLQTCEPSSLLFAGLKATALELPLDANLGFAYVIPYKDNQAGTTLAQFQIGKNGFVQLGMRSGHITKLNVSDVRDGEIIENNRLTGEIIFDWKIDREDLPVVGFVAYMRLVNGFEKSIYMTVKEIEKHGKRYSKTYSFTNSTWKDNFEAMAEKTVLKRLLSKYAPLSVDMAEAIKADQSIITDKGIKYIDSPESDTTEKVAQMFEEALSETTKEE